jgi:hypothetical protein
MSTPHAAAPQVLTEAFNWLTQAVHDFGLGCFQVRRSMVRLPQQLAALARAAAAMAWGAAGVGTRMLCVRISI